MDKISRDLAIKIAAIAVKIKDVPVVDDGTGVAYWEEDRPACFFCNAVRFGIMEKEEAANYQFTETEAWMEEGMDKEDVHDLLFINAGSHEQKTGMDYYRHAQTFLHKAGHADLLKENDNEAN